jgi:hypothetical protein
MYRVRPSDLGTLGTLTEQLKSDGVPGQVGHEAMSQQFRIICRARMRLKLQCVKTAGPYTTWPAYE